MLLQASTSCSGLFSRRLSSSKDRRSVNSDFPHYRLLSRKAKSSYSMTLVCGSVGVDDIAEIARNKVLIAASVSAAIGQLSKPFTSAILYGNKSSFDFTAALRAGGFPSTHSSAAMATATSIGLERGFSDAVFGLAVVYACLIMYDAQGVRREVGIHAKALNRTQLQKSLLSEDADDLIDSQPSQLSSDPEYCEPLVLGKANSYSANHENANVLLRSEKRKGQRVELISSSSGSETCRESTSIPNEWALLKESVGHNEIEVIAGALLGLFVSLAIYSTT